MILGELGCYPIKIEIQCRMLAFWYKLMIELQNGVSKLSCTMLKLQLHLLEKGEHVFPWLDNIKTLLNNLGLTYSIYGIDKQCQLICLKKLKNKG